ncbi:hypothetical protein Lpp126_13117, partial [Lacticaseibacillus paracasei subsp. paracasei Lpp126]
QDLIGRTVIAFNRMKRSQTTQLATTQNQVKESVG